MPNRIIERRRHRRHRLSTGATVVCARDPGRSCGTVVVTDLSAGGAQLTGLATPRLGARHVLQLDLPWYRTLTLEAQVVRSRATAARSRSSGVRWIRATARQLAQIEEAIAAHAGDPAPEPAVLVVGDGTTLMILDQPLRAARRRPILVTTLGDALAWLDRNATSVDTVVVDPGRWSREAIDPLLEVLDADYPQLRPVLLQPGVDLGRQLAGASGAGASGAAPSD